MKHSSSNVYIIFYYIIVLNCIKITSFVKSMSGLDKNSNDTSLIYFQQISDTSLNTK